MQQRKNTINLKGEKNKLIGKINPLYDKFFF